MEFLLTIILVFVFSGWVLKKFLPLLLTWYIKRKMKSSNGGEKEFRQYKGDEGKVTVETLEEREKVIEDNVGEYIDFEEDNK